MDQKATPQTRNANERSVSVSDKVSDNLPTSQSGTHADVANIDSPQHNLVVVYDSPQECPYLDGRVARMPLEYPRQQLTPKDLDQLLSAGYRRTGSLLYRTHCPGCQECVPSRVDVNQFVPSRSMRRVVNRGNRELHMTWGRAQVDNERLRLFNAHRAERSLSKRGPATLADYHEFLVATCVETAELTFRIDGTLIGIAIVDMGLNAMNAVYTHFSPQFGRYSIGTLAVLKQIEWAVETGRQYVYLGLYVADNTHLNYKDRFCPQQRLIDGIWREPGAN